VRPQKRGASRCESAAESISVQQLTETWQAQIEYLQEATLLRQLKADGKRSSIRLHVRKGMGVLQRLLARPSTIDGPPGGVGERSERRERERERERDFEREEPPTTFLLPPSC